MKLTVSHTWHNAGPHTIFGKLETRLGRKPTDREASDEVKRILSGRTALHERGER